MYTNRVTALKDRHSYGLSMIIEYPNNLTGQSAGKNDAPRDPLHGPVTITVISNKIYNKTDVSYGFL